MPKDGVLGVKRVLGVVVATPLHATPFTHSPYFTKPGKT